VKKLNLAVPTIVAIIGIAVVSRITTTTGADAYELVTAPTPYSLDHARVQAKPGEPEEQPATF
jgi:hypothetical protein